MIFVAWKAVSELPGIADLTVGMDVHKDTVAAAE